MIGSATPPSSRAGGWPPTTLRSLAVRVREMAPRTSDVPITLWTMLDRRGTRARVRTSLGRELVFVLQHTIHHEAVVAVLLAGRGRVLPGHFGLAPSTPRDERSGSPDPLRRSRRRIA